MLEKTRSAKTWYLYFSWKRCHTEEEISAWRCFLGTKFVSLNAIMRPRCMSRAWIKSSDAKKRRRNEGASERKSFVRAKRALSTLIVRLRIRAFSDDKIKVERRNRPPWPTFHYRHPIKILINPILSPCRDVHSMHRVANKKKEKRRRVAHPAITGRAGSRRHAHAATIMLNR